MTRAVLIAGGQGTRLGGVNPKVLSDIGGTTILDRQLDWLQQHGIFKITLALGYKADVIKDHIMKNRPSEGVEFVVEDEPLGTGGWMKLIGKPDRPVIVFNADNLVDYDPLELLRTHLVMSNVATIGVVRVPDISDQGSVNLFLSKIKSFDEKTGRKEPGFISSGHYVFSPSMWDCLPKKKVVSLEKDVFPKMAKSGDLGAHFILTDKFSAPDTPERLENARKKWGDE